MWVGRRGAGDRYRERNPRRVAEAFIVRHYGLGELHRLKGGLVLRGRDEGPEDREDEVWPS